MSQRPRVVIVGGGFAGLWAAKELARSPVDVTVVDRNNYHTFFPLLYQVAAAELQPGDVAHPIRAILRRQDNAEFVLAEATGLDLAHRRIETSAGPLHYDHLVLGPGSTTNWFGVDGAESHAFPLRTLTEAITLRNHVLTTIEAAHHQSDPARAASLTFTVVGGGPTGVEFAGALQELITGPLARDHHAVEISSARIVLVEAGPRLLSAFPERLSAYAKRRLERMGVEVLTETAVAAVDGDGIVLASGDRIASKTVVWAAGVAADADLEHWGLPVGRGGRVDVLPTLHVDGHPEIWVAGDSSLPARSGPMVAQNAMQQGRLAARNIMNVVEGRDLEEYGYRDYGTMAVIGRNAAVAHFGRRWNFTGYPAWLMWLGLHIVKLIGFRNRLAALMSWTGDYLFRDRVARLIIRGR
jgi:NADH dehydrogenase